MLTRSVLTRSAAAAATAAGLLTLAMAAPTAATKAVPGTTTGSASVFMVNPIQSSGDQSLSDRKDSASAVPASEYATVPMRNLDGSGYLKGSWVQVQSATGTPAFSSTNTFNYNRHQDQFEQVMGYFWVNQAQEYLQSLGFGTTYPGIVKQQLIVKVDK